MGEQPHAVQNALGRRLAQSPQHAECGAAKLGRFERISLNVRQHDRKLVGRVGQHVAGSLVRFEQNVHGLQQFFRRLRRLAERVEQPQRTGEGLCQQVADPRQTGGAERLVVAVQEQQMPQSSGGGRELRFFKHQAFQSGQQRRRDYLDANLGRLNQQRGRSRRAALVDRRQFGQPGRHGLLQRHAVAGRFDRRGFEFRTPTQSPEFPQPRQILPGEKVRAALVLVTGDLQHGQRVQQPALLSIDRREQIEFDLAQRLATIPARPVPTAA